MSDPSQAFGWGSSMSFEQSDIHELYSVLVEALSGIDSFSPSMRIFGGTVNDELRCPREDCNYLRESTSNFYSLSVSIPTSTQSESGESRGSVTLQQLIDSYSEPEILDENNVWECSDCSHRVQAVKTNRVTEWPQSLFIHINRLRYDMAAKKKVIPVTQYVFTCHSLFISSLTVYFLSLTMWLLHGAVHVP